MKNIVKIIIIVCLIFGCSIYLYSELTTKTAFAIQGPVVPSSETSYTQETNPNPTSQPGPTNTHQNDDDDDDNQCTQPKYCTYNDGIDKADCVTQFLPGANILPDYFACATKKVYSVKDLILKNTHSNPDKNMLIIDFSDKTNLSKSELESSKAKYIANINKNWDPKKGTFTTSRDDSHYTDSYCYDSCSQLKCPCLGGKTQNAAHGGAYCGGDNWKNDCKNHPFTFYVNEIKINGDKISDSATGWGDGKIIVDFSQFGAHGYDNCDSCSTLPTPFYKEYINPSRIVNSATLVNQNEYSSVQEGDIDPNKIIDPEIIELIRKLKQSNVTNNSIKTIVKKNYPDSKLTNEQLTELISTTSKAAKAAKIPTGFASSIKDFKINAAYAAKLKIATYVNDANALLNSGDGGGGIKYADDGVDAISGATVVVPTKTTIQTEKKQGSTENKTGGSTLNETLKKTGPNEQELNNIMRNAKEEAERGMANTLSGNKYQNNNNLGEITTRGISRNAGVGVGSGSCSISGEPQPDKPVCRSAGANVETNCFNGQYLTSGKTGYSKYNDRTQYIHNKSYDNSLYGYCLIHPDEPSSSYGEVNGTYKIHQAYDENFMTYGVQGEPGEYKSVIVNTLGKDISAINVVPGVGGSAGTQGAAGSNGTSSYIEIDGKQLAVALGGNGGKGSIPTKTMRLPGWQNGHEDNYYRKKSNDPEFLPNGNFGALIHIKKSAIGNVLLSLIEFNQKLIDRNDESAISYLVKNDNNQVEKKNLIEAFGRSGDGGYVDYPCWAGRWIVRMYGDILTTSIFPAKGDTFLNESRESMPIPSSAKRIGSTCDNTLYKNIAASQGFGGAVIISW